MRYSRLSIVVIAASLLGSQANAESTPSSASPAADAAHHMEMHGMFTREERMMLFADFFKATAGMSDDQKHAYRAQERARIMAMSDADRAGLKADLDSRWNALSADEKAAMAAKVQSFRAARHAGEHAE